MADACPLPVPENVLGRSTSAADAPPVGTEAARKAAIEGAGRAANFDAMLRQIADSADRYVVDVPQLGIIRTPSAILGKGDMDPIADFVNRTAAYTMDDIPPQLRDLLPRGFDPARIPADPGEAAEAERLAADEEHLLADMEKQAAEEMKLTRRLEAEEEKISRQPPPPPPPSPPRDGEAQRLPWRAMPPDTNILIRSNYQLEKLRFFRGSRFMQFWKRIAYAIGETLQSGRPVMPWRDFRDLMIFNGIHRHSSAITTLQIERQLDELIRLAERLPENMRTLADVKEMALGGDADAIEFMNALARHIGDWKGTIGHYRNASTLAVSHRTEAPKWVDLILDDKTDVTFRRTPDGVIVVRSNIRRRAGGREVVTPRQLAEEVGLLDGVRGTLEHLAAIARNAVLEEATSGYLRDRGVRKFQPSMAKTVVVGGQEVVLPAAIADAVAKHNKDLGLDRWFQSTLPWQVDSALTAASLTGDISALFNQVGIMLAASPKQFGKLAMLALLDIAGNREAMRKLHARVIANLGEQLKAKGITEDPEAVLVSFGLARTGIAEDIAGVNLYYRIPAAGRFFRNANTSFSDTLYAARLMLLERALNSPRFQEVEDPDTWRRMLHDYIQTVNDLTGTTNMRVTTAEKLTFLAGRLVRSQIVTPVLALVPGARGEQARRLVAAQALMVMFVTWAWNTLNGEDTEFNPFDPNWMTMRDVFGNDIRLVPWMGIIPALARSVEEGSPDPLANWALWKARPTVRTVINAIRKEDTAGMKHPGFSDPEIVKRIALNYVPLSARPLYEDRPGEQGYDVKGRVAETLASSLGMPASPLTISERIDKERDRVANELFGMRYKDLLGPGKADVNRNPEVKRLIDERKQRNTQLADTYEAERAKRSIEFDRRIEEIERMVQRGRDQKGKLYTKRDAREAINEAYAQLLTEQRRTDPVLDGWYNLRELARTADGTVDYEMLEHLRAEYLQAHPRLHDRLAEIEGQYDSPLLSEYRAARKLAREYYNIPAYLGLEPEESAIASRTISVADATVRAGHAINRAHALDLLVRNAVITPEERTLAIMAIQNGRNPARKEFLAKNPKFAEWYIGAVEMPSRSAIALGTRGALSPRQKYDARNDPLRKALRLRPVVQEV